MCLQRKSEGEHESSRRLKTQFLIEMEGFDSGSEQILLIGDLLNPFNLSYPLILMFSVLSFLVQVLYPLIHYLNSDFILSYKCTYIF